VSGPVDLEDSPLLLPASPGLGRRRATLRDIARAVGVSVATASRALRDDPRIGERTRTRVRLVAEELGYVPNHAARTLARSTSLTLGLMVPDVVDPMHGLVVTGFERVAADRGYAVIVVNGFRDPAREVRGAAAFRAYQVDAVALCGTVTGEGVTAELGPEPVILIGPEHDGDATRPSVAREHPCVTLRADDEGGIRQLASHLLATGRSRFVYLNGHPIRSNRVRREALARALDESGLPAHLEAWPSAGGWADYERLAKRVARERPDALVCYDDETALNLLAALRSRGIEVPRDVAVTGFDDIPFARIANPALTTVAQPNERLGEQAAGILMDWLASGEPGSSVTLSVELVVRESSAAVGAPGRVPQGRA
jgi:DNA-binding LacI/PurR family transcriptional regulator